MSIIRKIPKNQSKWINDIQPAMSGNYLVKVVWKFSEQFSRLEYDSIKNRWYFRSKQQFFPNGKEWYWWDEYNYYGEIRKLKIKFPNDREENK